MLSLGHNELAHCYEYMYVYSKMTSFTIGSDTAKPPI